MDLWRKNSSAPSGTVGRLVGFTSWIRLLVAVAMTAILFPGCALLKKLQRKPRSGEVEKTASNLKAAQLVGTIVLVNVEGAFVLIDNQSQPSPLVETKVQSRSTDGTSAELRVTEIRKRPFVIADIVGGIPQKGDQVFQQRQ